MNTVPPNCESIVPTALLEEVLTPLMKRLDRELSQTGMTAAAVRSKQGEEQNGAVQILSERVAAQTGWNAEAVSRRLYEIRNWSQRHRKATNVDTADALLIALGTGLREEDVPVFPGSARAARESVDVWAEDWTEEEREELAEHLHHFCHGFVVSVTMEEPEAICALAAKNSHLARRLLEHDGSEVSQEQVEQFQSFARGFYHESLPATGVKESLVRSNSVAYITALLCFHVDEPPYEPARKEPKGPPPILHVDNDPWYIEKFRQGAPPDDVEPATGAFAVVA